MFVFTLLVVQRNPNGDIYWQSLGGLGLGSVDHAAAPIVTDSAASARKASSRFCGLRPLAPYVSLVTMGQGPKIKRSRGRVSTDGSQFATIATTEFRI